MLVPVLLLDQGQETGHDGDTGLVEAPAQALGQQHLGEGIRSKAWAVGTNMMGIGPKTIDSVSILDPLPQDKDLR